MISSCGNFSASSAGVGSGLDARVEDDPSASVSSVCVARLIAMTQRGHSPEGAWAGSGAPHCGQLPGLDVVMPCNYRSAEVCYTLEFLICETCCEWNKSRVGGRSGSRILQARRRLAKLCRNALSKTDPAIIRKFFIVARERRPDAAVLPRCRRRLTASGRVHPGTVREIAFGVDVPRRGPRLHS
jgi:hypothetical protein